MAKGNAVIIPRPASGLAPGRPPFSRGKAPGSDRVTSPGNGIWLVSTGGWPGGELSFLF